MWLAPFKVQVCHNILKIENMLIRAQIKHSCVDANRNAMHLLNTVYETPANTKGFREH